MDTVEAEAGGGDPMELFYVKRLEATECFTRYRLQETLMLMGCRPKDAVAVTKEAFEVFHRYVTSHAQRAAAGAPPVGSDAALPWHYLHQCIYSALARLDYTKPHHLLDFQIAKEVTQRRQSFVVLLGGTSGTGKSTLAALLAARLRLTTVLPTDSVRHILRAFTSKEEHPSAFVSTYQAGDALSEAEVAALAAPSEASASSGNLIATATTSATRLHKRKVLRGYTLQSDVVLEKLDRVLTMFEERRQSLVVEGVHLNTDRMVELVKRHPNCVPFVIYISNEVKHRERFAVRARHMTIDPQENKYIKYFDNIRIIQRHLCKYADRFLIPKIDNTNVDRSIATIQSTLVRVLRKMDRGEPILDDKMNKMVLLSREHENAIKKAWSSKSVRKAMRPLLKQKVSKRLLLRRLLAEQTTDWFGAHHGGDDESSSSDEEEEVEVIDRHGGNANDADDEAEEDDEETTIVGSLVSGSTAPGRAGAAAACGASLPTTAASPARMQAQKKRIFLSEMEEHNAGTTDKAKMMRSLSAAIRQAALWRASQPLSSYKDWETVPPAQTPEVTFSEVMENMQSAAAQGFPVDLMRQKWRSEERRRSWMAGDRRDEVAAAMALAREQQLQATVAAAAAVATGTGVVAAAAAAASAAAGTTAVLKSYSESVRVESQIQTAPRSGPAVHVSFVRQEQPQAEHQLPPTGRKPRPTRRAQSLPPEALDLASIDFDLDSISMVGTNENDERLSQISSQRDECTCCLLRVCLGVDALTDNSFLLVVLAPNAGISPLEHESVEDYSSHCEVSSQSSVEG